MFGKLKEKLQNWTKRLTKESEKQEIVEEPKEKKKETKKPEEKKIKEIGVPLKFNAGAQKYEPDLEKIKDTKEELEETEPGKEGFFKKITSKINKIKISEEQFEIYGEELEMLLLENNVAVEVAEKIVNELKEQIVGKELLKKEIEEEIKETFKDIIKNILIEPFDLKEKINKKWEEKKEPYIILFCGINGTGKTTTLAKIADYLQKNKISCVLAAADTFRAASIEQLKNHAEKLDIKVISHEYGSDPAAVGFDAVKYAKKNLIKCVLIDTAGRIHTSKDLLREIEKIVKVTHPDLKVFVGESITGNDAIEQAKSFDWTIGIDAIVLTKADIDEKGGTSLSVGYVTKKPILFLGTGQLYDDIEPFDKEKFIKKLGL
jgi:fused signal recognition particle receptor